MQRQHGGRALRQVDRLNELELEQAVSTEASWHNDFNDSAYIYVGSLDPRLTEGDLLIIFSQFGSPIHIKLARDKETGKSRGFAFIKYEDQRSTVLAVDNLNGAQVLGRTLRVDHTRYQSRPEDTEYDQEQMKLLQDEILS